MTKIDKKLDLELRNFTKTIDWETVDLTKLDVKKVHWPSLTYDDWVKLFINEGNTVFKEGHNIIDQYGKYIMTTEYRFEMMRNRHIPLAAHTSDAVIAGTDPVCKRFRKFEDEHAEWFYNPGSARVREAFDLQAKQEELLAKMQNKVDLLWCWYDSFHHVLAIGLGLLLLLLFALTLNKTVDTLRYINYLTFSLLIILYMVAPLRNFSIENNLWFNSDVLFMWFSVFAGFFVAIALLNMSDMTFIRENKDIEYTLLIFMGLLSAMLIVGSVHLIATFIAFECLAFISYVLTAFERSTKLSSRSGIRYMFIGAIGTGIFVLGIVELYAFLGTFSLNHIELLIGGWGTKNDVVYGSTTNTKEVFELPKGLHPKATICSAHLMDKDPFFYARTVQGLTGTFSNETKDVDYLVNLYSRMGVELRPYTILLFGSDELKKSTNIGKCVVWDMDHLYYSNAHPDLDNVVRNTRLLELKAPWSRFSLTEKEALEKLEYMRKYNQMVKPTPSNYPELVELHADLSQSLKQFKISLKDYKDGVRLENTNALEILGMKYVSLFEDGPLVKVNKCRNPNDFKYPEVPGTESDLSPSIREAGEQFLHSFALEHIKTYKYMDHIANHLNEGAPRFISRGYQLDFFLQAIVNKFDGEVVVEDKVNGNTYSFSDYCVGHKYTINNHKEFVHRANHLNPVILHTDYKDTYIASSKYYGRRFGDDDF